MKDKEILVSINDDKNLKLKIKNIIDKAELASSRFTVAHSNFLDPFEQKIAYSYIKKFFADIFIEFYGGYDNSERKILIMSPLDGIDINKNEFIKTLIFYGRFDDITHRDVLGSIMALGIKREKIGDIIIYPEKVAIIILSEITDYMISNLIKIKNETIKKFELVENDNLDIPERHYDILNKVVSSMRADAIIGSVCNISREESQNLFKRGLVKINWEVVVKPHHIIKENDLISIKGYGRFILVNINGKTKSGKLHIVVQKI
jgi:RNA-binding protein YlmH